MRGEELGKTNFDEIAFLPSLRSLILPLVYIMSIPGTYELKLEARHSVLIIIFGSKKSKRK